jgi:hypothetical protein
VFCSAQVVTEYFESTRLITPLTGSLFPRPSHLVGSRDVRRRVPGRHSYRVLVDMEGCDLDITSRILRPQPEKSGPVLWAANGMLRVACHSYCKLAERKTEGGEAEHIYGFWTHLPGGLVNGSPYQLLRSGRVTRWFGTAAALESLEATAAI